MKRILIPAAAAAFSLAALSACSENAQTETEQAADAVGDDIETTTEGAVEETGEAAEATGDAIENGAAEAGAEIEEETDGVPDN